MTKPQDVTSPAERLSDLFILDGTNKMNDLDYSVAYFKWDKKDAIGIRWNGYNSEEEKVEHRFSAVGNPQSRNHPTWFVLPKELIYGVFVSIMPYTLENNAVKKMEEFLAKNTD